MSDGPAIARATFTPIAPGGKPFPVHFNPTSLQYQVTNSLKEEGNGKDKKQFITQSTAKLTLDLIFDTTLSGESVRTVTEKLVAFMQPAVGTATGGGKKAAAVVEFRWGGYAFKGMVESYKETLDFFSASGVPLRATVNLGLVQQDRTFETRRTAVQGRLQATPEPVVVPAPGGRPPGLTGGGGQDATLLAARAGDARAGTRRHRARRRAARRAGRDRRAQRRRGGELRPRRPGERRGVGQPGCRRGHVGQPAQPHPVRGGLTWTWPSRKCRAT